MQTSEDLFGQRSNTRKNIQENHVASLAHERYENEEILPILEFVMAHYVSCAPNSTMDTLLVCSYLKKQLFKTGLETTISQNVEPLLLGLGIDVSDEHLC